MSVTLNGRVDLIAPAARVVRTAIDVGDGGSSEQRSLVRLFAERFWDLPDLDLDSIEPISPLDVARVFDDEVAATRLRHLLVLLEVLRSPQTSEQVALIDGFALALGGDDDGLRLVREALLDDRDRAIEHLPSAWAFGRDSISAQEIRERYHHLDEEMALIEDPELAAQLRAMRDLPRGTLGREYIEFYLLNGFTLPGEGVPFPAYFVQHDMCHLVAGLGPTAPGELALSAFQVGMLDNDAHWLQFLMSIAAYELGLLDNGIIEAKDHVLERDGAMELMVDSFARGSLCTSNFNEVSLLSLADRPIAELRARFGVEPPAQPFPEFIS